MLYYCAICGQVVAPSEFAAHTCPPEPPEIDIPDEDQAVEQQAAWLAAALELPGSTGPGDMPF
jgi:hypothetical protein